MVASPCINVCQMHKATGYCQGCGRTIAEIVAWGNPKTQDAEKHAILQQLPARLAQINPTRLPKV